MPDSLWDSGLLPEQRDAASYFAGDARLLAGPGTGKTLALTKRVTFLIHEKGVAPNEILVLTFTRAAARELRQRVDAEIGKDKMPRISTIHSFALRELLRNAASMPVPLRIADDWEERQIVLEDLKSILKAQAIADIRQLFHELSSDWQSLVADEEGWDKKFPNPAFLGGFREHAECYGYVVRAELVYRLKRALEQQGDFEIDGPPRYLLVDEYQDLNRCDLAVAGILSKRGASVFAAGDDDQSIYGFRMAHPEGIRRFPDDYPDSGDLRLETCKRCDPTILEIGLFVARQDPRRLEKCIHADTGRDGGEVVLLHFPNQNAESLGIASICRRLTTQQGLGPSDILVLLRSDRNGAFSRVIAGALENAGIPAKASTAETSPLNERHGRLTLSLLRLCSNIRDHLAWRALIMLRSNGLGSTATSAVYEAARKRAVGFGDILIGIGSIYRGTVFGPVEARLGKEAAEILTLVGTVKAGGAAAKDESGDPVKAMVAKAIELAGADGEATQAIGAYFDQVLETYEVTSLDDLFYLLGASNEEMEQEIEDAKVNILTMHKAKGLTFEAVVLAAAEDEYVPGRAEGADAVDDERRLLYVSLTRAKRHLFITYCDRRTGQQRHSGSASGKLKRSLTRFLKDGPLTAQDGQIFVKSLENAGS